jgi:hypothetical protein
MESFVLQRCQYCFEVDKVDEDHGPGECVRGFKPLTQMRSTTPPGYVTSASEEDEETDQGSSSNDPGTTEKDSEAGEEETPVKKRKKHTHHGVRKHFRQKYQVLLGCALQNWPFLSSP